ncbi:TetR/AcrR family transcriptional regulator [Sphaerisporangium krabiense]|uniref:AcrR family transcriptional regulator n=1 Tax=Sphaerisporangium krabiense TaxID=763782 RepID=A0A7W8Z4Y5_9ACTN|nr:TetR/AcrR family transcriptional regulator [Sphaerisporangium krabiense]MBB5627467.1 AcrR family transcriptional regulator [Sphaerisporangium krabiense]
MAFTAKGLATRQRIIEGAAAHLRSDDPGDVTLDDVRATTGTSKSQLFHYFPGGKEELLLEVARFESGRVLEDQQPHLSALDSWDSWEQWREAVIARYRAQGTRCPLASLMNQVGSVPGASEVVTTLLRQWQEYLQRGITTMQEHGEVTPNLDAHRTAAAFIAGIQGGVSVLRSTGDTSHLEAILDLLLTHLRTKGIKTPTPA